MMGVWENVAPCQRPLKLERCEDVANQTSIQQQGHARTTCYNLKGDACIIFCEGIDSSVLNGE